MEEHTSLLANPRFWVAVAFVIFFVVFGRKLWTALAGILDARTNAVRAELEEATKLRQEAEAILRDAQARREAALADAKALLEGARAEAARVAEAATAEAQATAARRERMALDRIAAAEKAALRDVQIAAVDVATLAAQQVLAGGAAATHDPALIDYAIGSLPAALSGRRAA
jgi:F-type H+-transporting ATPase subunit b